MTHYGTKLPSSEATSLSSISSSSSISTSKASLITQDFWPTMVPSSHHYSSLKKVLKNVNLKHWKSKFEMTRGCQDSLIRQDLLRVLPPFQTFQKSPTSKLACLNINQNTFFIFQFLKIQQNTLWFLKTKTCTWEMAEGLVDLMVLELTKHFWQPCLLLCSSWTVEHQVENIWSLAPGQILAPM